MAAYAAVICFKAGLSRVLNFYDVALSPEFLNIIESLDKELKWLVGFIERLDRSSRKRMSAWLERIAKALVEAWENFSTDDGADEFVEKFVSLLEIMRKMREELHEEEEVVSSSSLSSSKMIGSRDDRSKLKEALCDYHFVREPVFLVAGMAGIGKTTLAREVYEDLDISEWFECRAWMTAGVGQNPDDLTEDILAQVDPEAHKMVMGGDGEKIAQRLKESLELGKRCLIVVDDVWDYDILPDYIKRVLLHNVESSRVVLTTRIKDERYADEWYIFEKRLLNKEESWDLLREKVFPGGSCPPQLEEAGKKIAHKCDGLPLTIVTVADLLSKVDESLWIDVANKKRHQLFIDAYDQISEVLYPSYEMLYDGLKLCFLYMGIFPLKYEIRQSVLVNMWTAEEIHDHLVKRGSSYATFLYAILYLVDCSLVMVYQRSTVHVSRSVRAIKTCGLHSSWWHFCQREARKINFFYVLDCPEDGLEEGIKGQSRLSFHNNVLFALKDVHKSIEKNCASSAQSLLCFGPYHQYMVPICFGLKFLQRLDALSIRFYDFPLEVLELGKLMHLALTCNRQLPPSISKLEKLQYLIVHPHLRIKSCGAPTYMPMEIWDLEELKHLEVLGNDLPDPGDKSLKRLLKLLDVSTASCTVLNRLPNLRKLRIRIVVTPEASDPLYCDFDHICNLGKIKKLTCIVANPGFKFQVVPPVASFPILPYKLKKLSLSGLGYPWKELKEIASLNGLSVLKLKSIAFHGQIWEVEESEFPHLYFLLLEDLDLVKLKGAPGSFRNLHHLSIKHCYKLEEIQLGGPDGVPRIEVVDSNPLVEKSIKQTRMGLDELPELLSVHSSWKSE